MVADDDLPILEVIRIILDEGGYKVITTSNGAAVEKIIKSDHPDLVILDVWMSGTDGREVAKKLKSQKETQNIPIIIVSALRETRKIAAEIGADDFLEKPFDISDLLKIVNKNTS
ncbi:response regulator [Candidatus Daviesbacteria bacterium]|nr:response regulator [Candidatus Daviesbacteria bacterium]